MDKGVCNKPQPGWLKTTEIHSPTVLEAKVQNEGVGRVTLTLGALR